MTIARDNPPERTDTGHGHVFPRPDGVKARCGGPGLCSVCGAELARKIRESGTTTDQVMMIPPDEVSFHPGPTLCNCDDTNPKLCSNRIPERSCPCLCHLKHDASETIRHSMPYEEHRRRLIEYLLSKVALCDWHGVSDAANDLRELDAVERGGAGK
jgi:hypothetical protein